jgi:hypothetical protein
MERRRRLRRPADLDPRPSTGCALGYGGQRRCRRTRRTSGRGRPPGHHRFHQMIWPARAGSGAARPGGGERFRPGSRAGHHHRRTQMLRSRLERRYGGGSTARALAIDPITGVAHEPPPPQARRDGNAIVGYERCSSRAPQPCGGVAAGRALRAGGRVDDAAAISRADAGAEAPAILSNRQGTTDPQAAPAGRPLFGGRSRPTRLAGPYYNVAVLYTGGEDEPRSSATGRRRSCPNHFQAQVPGRLYGGEMRRQRVWNRSHPFVRALLSVSKRDGPWRNHTSRLDVSQT